MVSSLKLTWLQIGMLLVVRRRTVAVAILHLGLIVDECSFEARKKTFRKPLRICKIKDGETAMWDRPEDRLAMLDY